MLHFCHHVSVSHTHTDTRTHTHTKTFTDSIMHSSYKHTCTRARTNTAAWIWSQFQCFLRSIATSCNLLQFVEKLKYNPQIKFSASQLHVFHWILYSDTITVAPGGDALYNNYYTGVENGGKRQEGSVKREITKQWKFWENFSFKVSLGHLVFLLDQLLPRYCGSVSEITV